MLLAKAAAVACVDLKLAGCPASLLRSAGYAATELLLAGFLLEDAVAAGYNLAELRKAEHLDDVKKLASLGYKDKAAELVAAGYSLKMIEHAMKWNDLDKVDEKELRGIFDFQCAITMSPRASSRTPVLV